MTTELARLARAVLDRLREHARENGVNTVAGGVNTPGPRREHARPYGRNGSSPLVERVHVFTHRGDERVNTVPHREHGNENGVNTPAGPCPSCGGGLWWRLGTWAAWHCWGCEPPPCREAMVGFEVLADPPGCTAPEEVGKRG